MRKSERIICCILSIVMLLGVFANGFAYAETGEIDLFQFVQDQYTLCVGEILSVSAVDPFSDGQTYFMSSSDSSVLYVNEDNEIMPDDHNISETIIGISAGWALLSVTSSDGRSRQCRITVKDNYIVSAENFFSNQYPAIEGRLYRDTPSKICLDNLGETSFQTAITIYDTMNNVSSFLGNIGTVYDKAIERKDVYLTVLLDVLGASSVFESLDNEVAREVMNAKAYFSLISKAMKTDWDIEIKAENGFSSLTSTQKDAFLAYSNDWFNEVHPIAAASKEVSSALSSVIDTCKSFEEYYNYLVKCGMLYEAGSALGEVLYLMRSDSRVSSDNDLQAAIDECYGIIQSNITAVGLQKAILNASSTTGKYVLGAIWWSGVTSSLYEAYPAVAVLQLVFHGEKLILNNVVNVDSLRKLYLEMIAITRLEETADKTLTALINRFDREKSSDAAQELLLALNIVYNMRIKDCELALEFVEVSDQNLFEQLRSLIFGEDRDLQKKILQWKQEYEQDITSINSFSPAKQLNDNQIDSPAKQFNDNQTDRGVIASGTCGEAGDNLTWTFYEDGSLVIEGSGKMADYLFLEGYPDQAAPWLRVSLFSRIEIERVEIANGVTSIGDCAFATYYCGKLTTVVIPDTVTQIGTWGFAFLSGLKSITLPAKIQYIGEYAFGETGLADVYYKGSEAEWNAVQKSVRDGLGIFNVRKPPTIHFLGSSSAQYKENYRSVIENMIASCAAEKADRNRTAYGMFVDLDDDGSEELVIVYWRDLSNVPTVLCDVYDVRDGQVEAVFEKIEICFDVAAGRGEAGVALYEQKPYLYTRMWTGRPEERVSIIELYDCSEGIKILSLSQRDYYDINGKTINYSFSEYTVDDEQQDEAAFNKLFSKIEFVDHVDSQMEERTLDHLLLPGSDDVNDALSTEAQIKLIETNRALWAFNSEFDDMWPWGYTITDLDNNGRLEVIAVSSNRGSGLYTYAKMWEVTEDGRNLANCLDSNYGEPWSGIDKSELICYFDQKTNSYYYVCEGMIRDGVDRVEHTVSVLELKDGKADWRCLATKIVMRRYGASQVINCYNADGAPISEEDYNTAVERRFEGMQRTTVQLTWFGSADNIEIEDNFDVTDRIVTQVDLSSSRPGPDDLKGQEGVASPTRGWLTEYQTMYVRGTKSGNAYLRWSPSDEGREYNRYVREGERVTVLASEGDYSLVKASDGRLGWVTSILLSDG